MNTTVADDFGSAPDDLLISLYRLAHRQQENFTTEALVYVLKHLVAAEPSVARRVLDWLSGGGGLVSSIEDLEGLRIRSQHRTDENGIPDVRIRNDQIDIIVEIKLDAGLTASQAEAYARELSASGAERKSLVALLRASPLHELPDEVVVRTWGELGLKLTEEAERSDRQITEFLISQFVALLNHLHLVPLQVRSPLSKAIEDHLLWVEANPDAPSFMRGRIGSIARLSDMRHLRPIKNLLLQMEQVLQDAQAVETYQLDSGVHSTVEPWIGFNIQGMDYFFYIPIQEPERLTFQRFRGGIDPRSFDGSRGEIYERYGKYCWSDTLDLSECGYLGANAVDQRKMIESFFQKEFAFGEGLKEVRLDESVTDPPLSPAK